MDDLRQRFGITILMISHGLGAIAAPATGWRFWPPAPCHSPLATICAMIGDGQGVLHEKLAGFGLRHPWLLRRTIGAPMSDSKFVIWWLSPGWATFNRREAAAKLPHSAIAMK
nr:hypothetical protein [Oceaniglobus trochenteri]